MSSGCVLEAVVGRLVDREATSGCQQTFVEIWCLRERLRFQEVFLVPIFFGRLNKSNGRDQPPQLPTSRGRVRARHLIPPFVSVRHFEGDRALERPGGPKYSDQ